MSSVKSTVKYRNLMKYQICGLFWNDPLYIDEVDGKIIFCIWNYQILVRLQP